MEITRSEEKDENITFTAKITIPYGGVNSNYTINQGDKVHFVIGGKDYYGNILCISTDNKHWITAYANVTLNHMHTGTYTVTATFDGDDHHFNITNSTLVVLDARQIWIAIEAADIYYNQTLVCYVTSNATNTENGFIYIRINGREVAIPDNKLEKDGSKVVHITPEMYKNMINATGEYTLSVMFINGTYYDYKLNFSNFNVLKFNTNISANVTTPIEYGDTLMVNVTVNETFPGFVAVRIGEQIYVAYVHDGIARINITGLAAKTYTDIPVTYYSNSSFYNSNSTKITFTVNKKSTYVMDVKADDIFYHENATVRVKLPTDATGNVTVWVDDHKDENVSIVEGTAVLTNISG